MFYSCFCLHTSKILQCNISFKNSVGSWYIVGPDLLPQTCKKYFVFFSPKSPTSCLLSENPIIFFSFPDSYLIKEKHQNIFQNGCQHKCFDSSPILPGIGPTPIFSRCGCTAGNEYDGRLLSWKENPLFRRKLQNERQKQK